MSDPDPAEGAIRTASPELWEALSPLGRRLRMPANFLPQQTAEARGKPFNATIGQITDGHGRAVPLSPILSALGGLGPDLAHRALLYSPVEGLADLRARWRERQRRNLPREAPSALPIATAGPAMALSLAAELFLVPGRPVVLPDVSPPDYEEIFCLRTGATPVRIPCGSGGLPEPGRLAAALAGAEEPALVVVRCPLQPGGEMPSRPARSHFRDLLAEAAGRRPVLALLDDVWHGDTGIPGGSLYGDLAGIHPGLIALKVDGADALGFGGGRIGFLTFPFDPGTGIARHLEDKVKILQRAIIGSPSAASQAVLLHALGPHLPAG